MLLHDALKNLKIGELLTCNEESREHSGLYIVYYINPASKVLTQAYHGDFAKNSYSDYLKKQLLYNHVSANFTSAHVLRGDWVIKKAEDNTNGL